MSNYCPPEGPIPARIAIVGEAPGADEITFGRPFIGGSGQLLNSLLSEAGINRGECYVTNVMKIRPSNNDFGVFYNDKQKREPSQLLLTAWDDLRKELARANPTTIIALGNEALRALTGRTGIFHWRGSILKYPNGKVIPTLHPAHILRQYTDRTLALFDLRRAERESYDRELRLPSHTFLTRPTLADVQSFLSDPSDRMAFDIETSGPHVRSLSISFSPERGLCIPFMYSPPSHIIEAGQIQAFSPTQNSYWCPEEEEAVLGLLDEVFSNPRIQKAAHNFPFDACLLERAFGLRVAGFYMDTMVAHHAIYCELPKDLGTCCSLYTRVPCYWDIDMSDDHQCWLYNCYDSAVTLEVSRALDTELEQHSLTDFYHGHLHRALVTLTKMEKRGVLINETDKEKNHQEALRRMEDVRRSVETAYSLPGFNPKSPKQMQELLYGKLHLPPQYNHKTKQITTDKNALDNLASRFPQYEEILESLKEHNSLATLVSGFLSVPLPEDKRFRTHYNLAGTVTGRLASSDPIVDIGSNLQNIKRGPFRRMFIAPPGWSLIKADLSQAEFRIVVWCARILRIIEKYATDPNYDIHRFTASLIFGTEPEKITKDQRTLAKNGVYGANYAMRDKTAAATYKMPLNMARLILSRYIENFPEIPIWWKEVQGRVNATRTLVSPFGRKRIFLDRIGDDLYRQAYSHTAQCMVADLINTALYELEARLDPGEARLLLQVHDEIVTEARNDCVERVARIVKQEMERPITIHNDLPPLTIPVEIGFGPNWYDQTPLKV